MPLSTFGGGCFRGRRAIKVMANTGGSPETIFARKVDGQSAGYRTSDLGMAAD